jgi:hypothetical protein
MQRSRRVGSTKAEIFNWYLERRTQRRSKIAWAKYGRKYGLLAFWLSITDVLVLQIVAKFLTKTILSFKNLIDNFKRISSQ